MLYVITSGLHGLVESSSSPLCQDDCKYKFSELCMFSQTAQVIIGVTIVSPIQTQSIALCDHLSVHQLVFG
jgi:hypothetical protein